MRDVAILFKKLTHYLDKKRKLLLLSLVFSAISAVLGLLPFVCLWLIARQLFVSSPAFDNVGFYAWLALISAIVSMLCYFLTLSFSHLVAFSIEVGMRKVGMKRIINMPLGFFDSHSSGKIRKIIDDNTAQTHTFLAHQLPDFAATLVAPVSMFILMLLIDWRMGLVSLIPIVLGFLSMSFMMSEKGRLFRQQYMGYLEEMSSESVEYVRGIPVVKTFGQSVHSFTRFVDSIVRYKEMVYAYTLLWRKPMAFYMVIMHCSAFFLVPLALFLMDGSHLGEVLSNFVFYLLIAPNFTLLFMRSMYFQNFAGFTRQSIEHFEELINQPSMSFVEKKAGALPTNFDVEFKNVVFSYENSEYKAVNDVSFSIRAGETIALIGASGGGKTTIARLLARFWDVQSGEIFIGGHNIKTLSQQKLMENVSFVFQSTKLFPMSLRDNITYGRPDASEHAIECAIDLSQSRDIIAGLEQGLETQVGKSGIYLSGGEQQRIALARAILKDAPIIILDEATAFADPENEHLIQQALRELSKNKTTLMIAHRLTTVRDADRILVLDEGKIIQSGTHEVLLKEPGAYQNMWREYQQSIDWKFDNAGGVK